MIKYTILALLLFAHSLPLNGMKRKRDNIDKESELLPAQKQVKEDVHDERPENNNNQLTLLEQPIHKNQNSIELQLEEARHLINLTDAKSLDDLNAIAQIAIDTIQRSAELNQNIEIQTILEKLQKAIKVESNLSTLKSYLMELSDIANINQYLTHSEIAKIMIMNLDYGRNLSFISKLSLALGTPERETLARYVQATKNIVSPLQYILVNIPSTAVQNAFKTTKALLFLASTSKVSAPLVKWTGKFLGKKVLKYVSENKVETGVSLASTAAYAYFGLPALLIPFTFNIIWSSLGFRSLTAYGAFERDAIAINNKHQEKLQRNTPHSFSTLDLHERNLTEFTVDSVGKQCFATDPMPLTPETQLILTQELLKNINVINLSGNHLTNNTNSLDGFSICTSLIFLCLADNNLRSLEFIGSIMQLKILDISNNAIDFGDASNLEALTTQKELIKLIIFNTQHPEFTLSDDAIQCLTQECPLLIDTNIYAYKIEYTDTWRGTRQEIDNLEATKQAALQEKQKKLANNESENEQKEISAIIEEVRIYLNNDQATLYDYINTLSLTKISQNSDPSEIKSVCKKLLLKYHPDKLHAVEEQKRQNSENVFKLLNKVTAIIQDKEKHALYSKMLNSQDNIID